VKRVLTAIKRVLSYTFFRRRVILANCYLCDEEAGEQYCFHCRGFICHKHASRATGAAKFPCCPLCDSEFYKPLRDFNKKLRDYAEAKKIGNKNELVKSVIERVLDDFYRP